MRSPLSHHAVLAEGQLYTARYDEGHPCASGGSGRSERYFTS